MYEHYKLHLKICMYTHIYIHTHIPYMSWPDYKDLRLPSRDYQFHCKLQCVNQQFKVVTKVTSLSRTSVSTRGFSRP